MRDPNAIISTVALAALLGQPNLHVYDCTTYNNPPPPGVDEPYIPLPGLATFCEAQIPGADFLDLQGEFSERSQRHWFMMPKDLAQLEAAFTRHGIGEGVRVVLYSIGSMMWSTRFWWMLRSLGFENAAVLDGASTSGKQKATRPRAAMRKAIQLPRSTRGRGPVCSSTSMRQWPPSARRHRHRECARPSVPSRSRAQPLRAARTSTRKPQRVSGNSHRSGNQRLHYPCRRGCKIGSKRRDERKTDHLLLRWRHLRHNRPLPLASARLRQPHALRRLNVRMGQGPNFSY